MLYGGNELILWECGIKGFEQYAFNGSRILSTVNVQHNLFSRIDASYKLIHTFDLGLSNNNISTIPDYTLCECRIPSGCANIIQTLDLSYNSLVSVSDFAFANLPELIFFHMIKCSLAKIPTNAINAA